jgi:Plants and Prokaryotes Conserved (PCC) domain
MLDLSSFHWLELAQISSCWIGATERNPIMLPPASFGEEAGPLAPGVAGGAWSSVILDEQVELLSLIGDVAVKDGEPQVHAHAVVGKRDGTAHGGHLLQARVRPTCELVLTESPAHLRKEFDPVAGIALIKL